MRRSARALATTTTSRPSASACAAAMRLATQEGSDGFAANTLSVRSGKRMTRSSPRYAATCWAKAIAASSPATTTSVVCGR